MLRTRTTSACLVAFALLALAGWALPSAAQTNPLSISATPPSGTAPLTVVFEAFFQGMDYYITFDWDFGDGSAHESSSKTSHLYPNAGIYPVTLTARDYYSGYVWTADITIEVWEPVGIVAEQAPLSGAAPLTVNFRGQASGGKPPYRFQWDFGDGQPPSNERDPVHTFTTDGDFKPSVRAWDSTGAGASDERLVTAVAPSGPLQGRVGVYAEGNFYLLNGTEIQSAFVTAKDTTTGENTKATVVRGVYAFDTLVPGVYDLTATLTYTDHIPYDADLLAYGCVAPSGGTVLKEVTSRPVRVTVTTAIAQDVVFPPPLAFLHGALDCYQKWYAPGSDPALVALWDNDARMSGFLSFTPNYEWWVTKATWPGRAEEVYVQLGQDLAGISTMEPPLVLVAHDMGGLVARALAGGWHNGQTLTEKIRRIYLVGTPNSGSEYLLGGGPANLMSPEEIVRRFNQTYPDFGGTEVYAIAGSKGLWGLGNSDGRVSLYSAFTISLQECSADALGFPSCKTYPALMFDSGEGHIFDYSHYELGGPDSTAEILDNTILPWVGNLSAARAVLPPLAALAPGDPKSPAGSIIWGTTGRTVETGSQSVPPGAREREGQMDMAFDISDTDGMIVYAQVWAGSAEFEVIGPAGERLAPCETAGNRSEEIDPGFKYSLLNPTPGTYTLRVMPGSEGASFSATAAEDSIFGITGYLTRDVFSPGATALLRMDFDGFTEDVRPSLAEADLLDGSGNLLAVVPLFDDGKHQDGQAGDGLYGGTTQAPTTPGAYPVLFRARGTYRDAPFKRSDLARLYVVPQAHLFTGTFSDAPADLDQDGYYETLSFRAELALPAGTAVVVSGDLFCSAGVFIAHAAGLAIGSGPGKDEATLAFALSGAHCSQFGAPFQVRNLLASEGYNLVPLDSWSQPVPTATYLSSDFLCLPGAPHPSLSSVEPDEGVPGQSLHMALSGSRFKSGATLASSKDVVFSNVRWFSESMLYAQATIASGASPGPRTLTVRNPDGTTGTLPAGFTVSPDRGPSVTILSPNDGEGVSGPVFVTASASDDIRVIGVTFSLDGEVKAAKLAFPYIWTLDASTLDSGPHTLMARATDNAGLTADASVTVYKDPPTITGIQKLGSPFRLKITGGNFQPGASVFLGDDAAPWSNTVVRSESLILVRGGAVLKAKFPKGVPVPIRVLNPNGAEATGTFTRP